MALGHVRYSTTGSSLLCNAQPFRVRHSGHYMSIAHNGNIVNAHQIRSELEQNGSIFQTTMDSEVVLHLMARRLSLGMEQAMVETMGQLRGAYSVVVMTEDSLIAAKDPNGFRPLCLGKLNGGYVVGPPKPAPLIWWKRNLSGLSNPGEIVIIDKNGNQKHSFRHSIPAQSVYFRADLFLQARQQCIRRERLSVPKTAGRTSGQGIPSGRGLRDALSRFRELRGHRLCSGVRDPS